MSPQCTTCQEHVKKLNQQVSVMRKEIKNLRQMLESATRAHRKHMISLQSAVSEFDLKKPTTQTQASNCPVNALEQGIIQTAPIGYISSCFSVKNGTPRQPTICAPSRAELRIQQSVFNNPEHALVGLEQYSHVWIIFVFHKNGHLSAKAKVKPPRLNGQKVGVYSTRSPHRPNALGLTLAKLDRVRGDTIYLSEIDVIDGTPVLDVKPYIPEYDSTHTRVDADTLVQNQPFVDEEFESDHLQITEKESIDTSEIMGGKKKKLDKDHSHKLTSYPSDHHLQNVLEEVKAYVTQHDINMKIQNNSSKIKPLSESSAERPCYGQEAYSTIASWIREPPVSSLEVRFTEHAQKELAEFLPAGSPGDGPALKFLHSTEEAVSAIRAVLSADPRSVYRRDCCSDRLFYFSLDTADLTCWFGQGFAEVLRVRPVQEHIQEKTEKTYKGFSLCHKTF